MKSHHHTAVEANRQSETTLEALGEHKHPPRFLFYFTA